VNAPAAGVCPAVHERLTRRRAVARAVGQAISSRFGAVSSALSRVAQAFGLRPPV
jgi:hypothetical protein